MNRSSYAVLIYTIDVVLNVRKVDCTLFFHDLCRIRLHIALQQNFTSASEVRFRFGKRHFKRVFQWLSRATSWIAGSMFKRVDVFQMFFKFCRQIFDLCTTRMWTRRWFISNNSKVAFHMRTECAWYVEFEHTLFPRQFFICHAKRASARDEHDLLMMEKATKHVDFIPVSLTVLSIIRHERKPNVAPIAVSRFFFWLM